MARRPTHVPGFNPTIRKVDAAPSAAVPGRREVGSRGATADPRANVRSADESGRAVTSVYGGPVSSEPPGWSGDRGANSGPRK